ncbi:MAG: peptidoglycan-binding protein [Lachnospiraceae bacterium]|nr:peptidoglycan-binding protein [Lachnospiraceae bacterium]
MRVYPASVDTQGLGELQVNVTSAAGNRPIDAATVTITPQSANASGSAEQLRTGANGKTDSITLPTPPLDYSLTPGSDMPYSEYQISVTAPGFEPLIISGAEILPTVQAIQNITLDPSVPAEEGTAEEYVIPDHTLYGEYPPKIVEDEVKEVESSDEIVLSRVVIPEFIVVHDGAPTNTSAQNYYVRYKDYIKNVASSEIYATWPESTIYANVLAIQSFTLNRVYTEWYRNKGYNFTITSSTAYDHKFIPERNIFNTISTVVDSIFNNYLSRPNVKQPILTQYCDGKRVSCPGLMTQWGSMSLGEDGLTPIEILRYYYGENMYINSTDQISGVPSSWPGSNLTIGSSGSKVLQLQEQLNAIANVYSNIPKIAADGSYGQRTADSVRAFQQEFDLPQTGVVDFATWYKISGIYVAITRIAEYS